MAFVDGGVFANNPSILAYSEGKELWKRKIQAGDSLAIEADVLADDQDYPFFMLSIGTGFSPNAISGDQAMNWRTKDWIEPLLSSIFMHSVAESTHYAMQHLLPPYKDATPRYYRVDFELPKKNMGMDDASHENIDQLCALAEQYVKDNEKQLQTIISLIA